jgi:hypothetical protein
MTWETAMKSVSAITVHATWDKHAHVWVATSDDIDGLAVEAKTMEILEPKVTDAIHDLIELNGMRSTLSAVPVYIMVKHLLCVINPLP